MSARRIGIILLATLFAWLGARRAYADTPRPELRGFWVDGFHEGIKTPDQIDSLLRRVREAGCNAVFAEVRKGGDAYYISRYDPWAADDPSHFDALACLIAKAHAMRPPIAVHAWLNVCSVGANRYALPGHIATSHSDWLSLNARGSHHDPEAWKIDPGNPDAADWTFRVLMDVVRHYNVDGIHLDAVRYGGRGWGYNPTSLARFERLCGRDVRKRLAGTGLPAPDDPAWQQWRRRQVTELVRKIYAQAVAIRPQIVVSAAVIAWRDAPKSLSDWIGRSAAMNRVYQDWRGWLQQGILDLACPMTYFTGRSGLKYESHWAEWIKDHQYGRRSTVAVACFENTLSATLQQLRAARATSALGYSSYGVMLYSYAGTGVAGQPPRAQTFQTELYSALGRGAPPGTEPGFGAPAVLPAMPWKLHPHHGIVKGVALAPDLAPCDGAVVHLASAAPTAGTHARSVETDGSGFFAFVGVSPGRYRLSVATPAGEANGSASVHAGEVATVLLTAPSSHPGRATSVMALRVRPGPAPDRGFQPPNRELRLDGLTVLVGTDTSPGSLVASDARGRAVEIRPAQRSVLALQPGDVISALGTPGEADGEPLLTAATAALTDIRPLGSLARPRPASAGQVALGETQSGSLLTVEARVSSSTTERLQLLTRDGKIEVPLAGRKEPDTESTELSLPSVEAGDTLRVTGLAWRGASGPELLPRFGADLVVVSRPSPELAAWLRWLLVCALLSGIAAGALIAARRWGRRRLRRMR